MREIPLPYIKSNQAGIVLFVVLSFVLSQPWLLAALWLVQVVGLLTQGRGNVFVLIAKPFLNPEGKETQAAELTRFNNSLAVLFLTLSLLAFALGWNVVGYIFAAMLIAAAGAALLGYCVGCTIYFQYKQFKARRRITPS
ncbi:DUF4395 domain-containing protein [Cohnella sp. REN36]|uniref:DUF4395 domain-containing protein n=1 Tax=Cohnella sp. REN36 TaxID=2887347 RepID=UPI001D14F489|nr:DUF4395 domain-containing protein [Cohnella sp. REN36]MCC3377621.1 DUF4395 domain-containing protein [Cohnella sp. REN36]